ncbi:MAG: hypothetical protein EZS28_040338, partial [Streblomastix strix]
GERLRAEQVTAYEELLIGWKAEKVSPSFWHLLTSFSEFFKWPIPQISRGSGGNGPSGNVSQQKRKNEVPNGDIHTLSPQGGDLSFSIHSYSSCFTSDSMFSSYIYLDNNCAFNDSSYYYTFY